METVTQFPNGKTQSGYTANGQSVLEHKSLFFCPSVLLFPSSTCQRSPSEELGHRLQQDTSPWVLKATASRAKALETELFWTKSTSSASWESLISCLCLRSVMTQECVAKPLTDSVSRWSSSETKALANRASSNPSPDSSSLAQPLCALATPRKSSADESLPRASSCPSSRTIRLRSGRSSSGAFGARRTGLSLMTFPRSLKPQVPSSPLPSLLHHVKEYLAETDYAGCQGHGHQAVGE